MVIAGARDGVAFDCELVDRGRVPDPPNKPPSTPGVPAGSCAFVLIWNGATYVDFGASFTPMIAEPLGHAEVSACDDTGGGPGESEFVGVAAIAGIPPEEALTLGSCSFASRSSNGRRSSSGSLRPLAARPPSPSR